MHLDTTIFADPPTAAPEALPVAHEQAFTFPLHDDDLRLLNDFIHYHDAQAFSEIARRYAGMVYATCLRIVGDASRAEDVSQETFFRLISRGHEVRTSLPGWLHRTATHLALDAIRNDGARKRHEIDYCQSADHAASTWSELSPAVDQALCDLPEELRQVLVQHFLLGRTQAEIAQRLHLSAPTVSRRVRDGLEQLRVRLRLKGVVAMSVALAGLLCQAAARKAPASLVRELGKMAIFKCSGGAAPLPAALAATTTCGAAAKVFAVVLLLGGFFLGIFAIRHFTGRIKLPVIYQPLQHEEPRP